MKKSTSSSEASSFKKSDTAKGSKQKKVCCFTLIELLVVIAIIAILAGMLLPTLSKAKEAGKKIACNNKLRTLLTYSALYSNTFNDFIPHVVGNAEDLNWATYKGKYNNKI